MKKQQEIKIIIKFRNYVLRYKKNGNCSLPQAEFIV